METTLWHPKHHCHLGDIITIVQSLHRQPGKKIIFGNRKCRCGCGRVQADTLSQVISLLDTQVVFGGTSIPPEAQGIDPIWAANGGSTENNTYVKAKYLPVIYEQIITVQFTPVMIDSERFLSSENMRRLFGMLKSKGVARWQVVNLSDATIFEAPNPFWGIDPFAANVVDKFNVIAKAALHISADSGTAHLAAMSDTPVVVICPIHLWNRYRTQSNIVCCSNVREAEVAICSIMESLWSHG